MLGDYAAGAIEEIWSKGFVYQTEFSFDRIFPGSLGVVCADGENPSRRRLQTGEHGMLMPGTCAAHGQCNVLVPATFA